MSPVGSTQDPAAIGFAIDCDCKAMHQLSHLHANAWDATGSDPQFLLGFPLPLDAGVYRIVATLHGQDPVTPCLYMDHGDGWSEATSMRLERCGDGGRWSITAYLPRVEGPARFDPMDHAGEFRFDGVTIERLADSEALLTLLGRCVEQDPASAAALFQQARNIAASHGFGACCRWLISLGENTRRAGEWTSYQDWIRQFEVLAPGRVLQLRDAISRLPRRPLISLVLVVTENDASRLQACLDSVLGQIYPDWELCLAEEGNSNAAMKGVLEAYAATCSRVRLIERERPDQRLSWSDAFSLAHGSHVAFLHECPVLPPHAIFAFADAIIRNAQARIFYSDVDRMEASGFRADPYFKPDWNAELLVSQDYLNPLAVYDSALVRAVGGPGSRMDGNGLHELALRCVTDLNASGIVHLPLVLCHARELDVAASQGSDGNEPGVAVADAGSAGHGRIDEPSRLAAMGDSDSRPRQDGPQPAPKVSLIIPTRDRLDLLRRCIDSILSLTTYPNFEVVIVDNQSAEPATLEYLSGIQASARVRVISFDAPFNYSAINNHAVDQVDGEIIGLINNDIEVISPDWLEQMVKHAIRPGIGAVGAMLYYPDDTIQHAGVMLGLGGVAGHPYSRYARGFPGQMGRARLVQSLSAVTGACLLVRRQVYQDVGGLNERLTIAFNDVDFCLKLLKHGCRNVWTPFAELYHHESASRGSEDTPEKKARFQSEVDYMIQTWGDLLGNDPAYNPNLSLKHGDAFALAFEPRHSLDRWVQDVTRQ
jgi:GT2 family glycosyltransferase